jgi:hypothetical protein
MQSLVNKETIEGAEMRRVRVIAVIRGILETNTPHYSLFLRSPNLWFRRRFSLQLGTEIVRGAA